MGSIPVNEEHAEAVQHDIDKGRYEYISKLSKADQKRWKKMENCVEQLIGLKCPFMLLVAPDRTGSFWKYQTYTQKKLPLSDKEETKVAHRAFASFGTHSRFFSSLYPEHKIVLVNDKDEPYYMFRDGKHFEIKKSDSDETT